MIGNRRYRSLTGLIVAGCVVMFGAGDFMGNTTAEASDPFSSLRISRVEAGAPIPAFDLKALDGASLRSQDLAGKVVLLNFWATWCGPCKEEMPSLARLQAQFDPAQLRVVTVTADMYPQGIRQFLDHLGVRLPVLFERIKKSPDPSWRVDCRPQC